MSCMRLASPFVRFWVAVPRNCLYLKAAPLRRLMFIEQNMRVFRLSQRCSWDILLFGICRRITGKWAPDGSRHCGGVVGSYSLFAYRTNLEYEFSTRLETSGSAQLRGARPRRAMEQSTSPGPVFRHPVKMSQSINLPYSPLPFSSCWSLLPLALRSEATVYKFYNQCTKNGTTHVNKSSFVAAFFSPSFWTDCWNLLPACRWTRVLWIIRPTHPASRHVASWLKFTYLCKQSVGTRFDDGNDDEVSSK